MRKMIVCRASYVFFFFAVAITVAAGDEENISGYVSFSDTTVTLTCPFEDVGDQKVTWDIPNGKVKPEGQTYSKAEYTDKDDGMYKCTDSEKKKSHYFYIKAKVCKGCVDLDMLVAFAFIFGDVLITVGVVIMVYLCARKKAGAAAPQRAAQPRQQRGPTRGPPVPDPDYQPLNPATRANDVYAQANRR